jgi:hypothetical protein
MNYWVWWLTFDSSHQRCRVTSDFFLLCGQHVYVPIESLSKISIYKCLGFIPGWVDLQTCHALTHCYLLNFRWPTQINTKWIKLSHWNIKIRVGKTVFSSPLFVSKKKFNFDWKYLLGLGLLVLRSKFSKCSWKFWIILFISKKNNSFSSHKNDHLKYWMVTFLKGHSKYQLWNSQGLSRHIIAQL